MAERAPTHVLDGSGVACIHLTPRLKHTLSDLAPGDVLRVDTDDPAAREGIPSWCRLTNNSLLDVTEHDTKNTSFTIRKKDAQ
jgi:tRNA 2-thiouridine synthesizing protein A